MRKRDDREYAREVFLQAASLGPQVVTQKAKERLLDFQK
jgi:hypothetical protein